MRQGAGAETGFAHRDHASAAPANYRSRAARPSPCVPPIQAEQAIVVTGPRAPWYSADAYLDRAETVDGACYVLIPKVADVPLPGVGGRQERPADSAGGGGTICQPRISNCSSVSAATLRKSHERPVRGILLNTAAIAAPPMPPCTISSRGSTIVLVRFAMFVRP